MKNGDDDKDCEYDDYGAYAEGCKDNVNTPKFDKQAYADGVYIEYCAYNNLCEGLRSL